MNLTISFAVPAEITGRIAPALQAVQDAVAAEESSHSAQRGEIDRLDTLAAELEKSNTLLAARSVENPEAATQAAAGKIRLEAIRSLRAQKALAFHAETRVTLAALADLLYEIFDYYVENVPRAIEQALAPFSVSSQRPKELARLCDCMNTVVALRARVWEAEPATPGNIAYVKAVLANVKAGNPHLLKGAVNGNEPEI